MSTSIRYILLRICLIVSGLVSVQAMYGRDFIPSVEQCSYSDGCFRLTEETSLLFEESLRDIAVYILDYVPFRSFSQKGDESKVMLRVNPSLGEEAYTISVRQQSVTVSGGSYAGVFNGVMTLFQLLPPRVYSRNMTLPVSIPCCEISDHPRFGYRWLCLDVARTWISVDALKRYVDLLAYHKINKLHLHLSDDEGWRVEIKSHPEFAKVGGFRGGDSPVYPRYDKFDEKWGGFYTQDELRSIVGYAAKRNIEIIPEIDMPGHSKALGNVCPDILCPYTPDTSATNGLDIRNVWCASNESNYRIIEDVIREMSDIFPSRFFHIGGDEVVSSVWDKCPSCRRLKREKGYAETRQLQDYFMSRVIEILSRYGKVPSVWNDGIHGDGLPKSTIVCAWKSQDACMATAGLGFPTIVMTGSHFYLDMKQSEHEYGHNWASITDARKVYSFSFDKYTEEQLRNVIGVGATFFSEIYIEHNPDSNAYLDYMLFPRLCSMSDVAWRTGSSGRAWDEFYKSLRSTHYERMSAMNIGFRLFPPRVRYENGCLTASVDDGSDLYYSDGGEWRRYGTSVRTTTPERYLFQSRKGTGESFRVGSDEYYRLQRPATHITSSMEFASDRALERVEKYEGGIARTRRAAHKGDWIQYSFDNCVRAREMFVQTGHVHLRRCLFLSGHVEVSRDGVNFVSVGTLHNGGLDFVPQYEVKAVRVVCDSRSDAEDNVVVASITIK